MSSLRFFASANIDRRLFGLSSMVCCFNLVCWEEAHQKRIR